MSIALRLALCLPRDASTVPVVRRILDQALTTLGVAADSRDDVGLILTEACANVVEHARTVGGYDVSIDVTDARCVIEVVNRGPAVDPARLDPDDNPSLLDEHGRGLHIIRALADELYLTPADEGGLLLRAVATLRWQPRTPIWQGAELGRG